ncbi:MAG: aldo/keto reductase, partial [Ketobacter sp.]
AYDVIEVMRGMADERQCSVAQIALSWLLHQKAVSSVIVGAKQVQQLQDNIAATSITLTSQELARLDDVSRLPAEYPGWMLERQGEYRNQ